MPAGPNLREQKLARTIDREVSPVWNERFARLLWRHLPPLDSGMVLDVHSGVGHTLEQLLTRLPAGVRVLGLEANEAMRALAKSKLQPEWKKRVYLKPEDVTAVADMNDGLYDLVVGNLVLSEAHDLAEAIEGLIRVTKPGGTLLATLQMRGTWTEAEDLLREVLRDEGLDAAQNRLRRMANLRPTGPDIASVLQSLGLSRQHFVVEQERFSLLFGSGREFLFSPLVEYGPLRLWKAVIATEGNPQQAFFRFKEAIDTYCSSNLFRVTAVAGAVVLQRPVAGEDPATLPGTRFYSRFPTLDALWTRAEAGEMPEDGDGDIDIDFDDLGQSGLALSAVDEPELDERVTSEHLSLRSGAAVDEEDEALKALLEQQPPSSADEDSNNLDALLDQVLEFERKPAEAVEEIDAEEVELVDVDPRRPGETLKRIKALLPPPPTTPPPPPPTKKPK